MVAFPIYSLGYRGVVYMIKLCEGITMLCVGRICFVTRDGVDMAWFTLTNGVKGSFCLVWDGSISELVYIGFGLM